MTLGTTQTPRPILHWGSLSPNTPLPPLPTAKPRREAQDRPPPPRKDSRKKQPKISSQRSQLLLRHPQSRGSEDDVHPNGFLETEVFIKSFIQIL